MQAAFYDEGLLKQGIVSSNALPQQPAAHLANHPQRQGMLPAKVA